MAMASWCFSKTCALITPHPNPNHNSTHRSTLSIVLFKSIRPLLLSGSSSSTPGIQAIKRNQNGGVMKVSAQLNEVDEGKSSVSAPPSENSTNISSSKTTVPDVASITTFMNQVAGLVELVDSRDIIELQLKQDDCEVIIRKKEALPPPPAPPIVMMQSSQPQPMFHSQPPPAQAAPATSAAAASASPPALPTPAKPKSSHPPLKCPMAGTFYRAPAPGAPPFVKVSVCHSKMDCSTVWITCQNGIGLKRISFITGQNEIELKWASSSTGQNATGYSQNEIGLQRVGDKVQKGQVICIIEAMKLMNEIEADQSGTIVDIIAEDGKPVSLDTPILVIEP